MKTKKTVAAPVAPPAGKAPTVSHLLGEMTWLLSQSPLHKALAIGDLEWLIMPALIHEQFYIFKDGDKPVGLALWAKCNDEAERKLEGGMIEPENRLTLEEWTSGDRIWLVDLIAFRGRHQSPPRAHDRRSDIETTRWQGVQLSPDRSQYRRAYCPEGRCRCRREAARRNRVCAQVEEMSAGS